jgi:hypothetical protein
MSGTIVRVDVRQRRELAVRDDIDAENLQDALGTLASFSRSSARMGLRGFGADGQLSDHFDCDQLPCERAYFDLPDIARQLTD